MQGISTVALAARPAPGSHRWRSTCGPMRPMRPRPARRPPARAPPPHRQPHRAAAAVHAHRAAQPAFSGRGGQPVRGEGDLPRENLRNAGRAAPPSRNRRAQQARRAGRWGRGASVGRWPDVPSLRVLPLSVPLPTAQHRCCKRQQRDGARRWPTAAAPPGRSGDGSDDSRGPGRAFQMSHPPCPLAPADEPVDAEDSEVEVRARWVSAGRWGAAAQLCPCLAAGTRRRNSDVLVSPATPLLPQEEEEDDDYEVGGGAVVAGARDACRQGGVPAQAVSPCPDLAQKPVHRGPGACRRRRRTTMAMTARCVGQPALQRAC